jgi:hypothetical protein
LNGDIPLKFDKWLYLWIVTDQVRV